MRVSSSGLFLTSYRTRNIRILGGYMLLRKFLDLLAQEQDVKIFTVNIGRKNNEEVL